MMYVLDWITCCCYLALSKIRYIDWDIESSAIINSGVIVGIMLINLSNLILLSFSPITLQTLYNYGTIYYVSTIAIAMSFVSLRYYYFRKDALSSMENIFRERKLDRCWLLIAVDTSIIIFSFALLFFVAQYVKSKGIIFG